VEVTTAGTLITGNNAFATLWVHPGTCPAVLPMMWYGWTGVWCCAALLMPVPCCAILFRAVLCHAVQVAVGEKHTLLVQSWVAPALPDSSDDYTSLVTLSSSSSSAFSHTRSHQQQQQQHVGSDTEEDLLLYGEAADALSSGGSSSSSPAAAAAAARGSSGDRSQPPNFSSSSDRRGHTGGADVDHNSSISKHSGGQGIGPESLHSICQRVVALQLVEPRTAPTLLEYADVASAHLLKAYCLAVAVRNMDSCIAEARPAFEALPQHLLQQVGGGRLSCVDLDGLGDRSRALGDIMGEVADALYAFTAGRYPHIGSVLQWHGLVDQTGDVFGCKIPAFLPSSHAPVPSGTVCMFGPWHADPPMPHLLRLLQVEQLYRHFVLAVPAGVTGLTAAAAAAAPAAPAAVGATAVAQQQQQQQGVLAADLRPLGMNFVIPGGEFAEDQEQQDPQQQQQQQQRPLDQRELQQQQPQQASAAVQKQGKQQQRRHLYKRLQQGLRPSSHPEPLPAQFVANMFADAHTWPQHHQHSDSAAAAAAAPSYGVITAADGAVGSSSSSQALGGSEAAASGRHGSSAAAAQQQQQQQQQQQPSLLADQPHHQGSFTSEADRVAAAVAESTRRLHRQLTKKLQQIEALEQKQQQGGRLDPQQLAKLSIKGSICDALGQLQVQAAAGVVALDDIQVCGLLLGLLLLDP
jgi:hypothetical protein